MSHASTEQGRAALRQDLTSIRVRDRVRPYRIVIDEIGGRFARVSENVWQRLARGDRDPELWAEANAAGWLRNRTRSAPRGFSPLSIPIRLGSIDRLAKILAPHSDVFFGPRAITCWLLFIALAAAAVVSRSDQWLASLGSLPAYLKQSSPLLMVMLFVTTKAVHELAHAVMCRRMGARCRDAGILLLCGMPCPYCDVTDIWRQPAAAKRAWVMLAGIYIELIIAALAAVAWMMSPHQSTQLAALNVMLICGVSTVVFNANPLMRYDGYYLLADIMRSANLRGEARSAFDSVVTRRLAGAGYAVPPRNDPRAMFLSVFHVAGKLYRVAIACAIAALLIRYAGWLGLQTAAICVIAIVALFAGFRIIRALYRIVVGRGRWRRVALPRRIAPVVLLAIVVLLLLLVPLPRYRRAAGVIDAADARVVYLPEDGVIDRVAAEFGELVSAGDPLVRLDRQVMLVQQTKLQGDFRLAGIRSELARRAALDQANASRPKTADQWTTLRAVQQAAETQLASIRQRINDADVRAAVSGVVIPAAPTVARQQRPQTYLSDRVGTAIAGGEAWCRVSESGKLQAALLLDARDRASIQVGSTVMIRLMHSPQTVFKSRVTSVSAIQQVDLSGPAGHAAYQALCPLPDVDDADLLTAVGQECKAVIRLPRRTLASVFASWLEVWFRG